MNAPKYPLAAVFCNLIGAIQIIVGIVMIVTAARSLGSDAAMGFSFGVLFGAVLWFALASALSSLSKIEFNTRKPIQLPRNPPKSAGLGDSLINSP